MRATLFFSWLTSLTERASLQTNKLAQVRGHAIGRAENAASNSPFVYPSREKRVHGYLCVHTPA
jgi:hypothetical protein